MKQFNLEEYLKNPSRKVVTREGRNVNRILCTDLKGDYPIVAVVESYTGNFQEVLTYANDGAYYYNDTSKNDLFFASEKHEGWVNVYRDLGLGGLRCRCIFDSEEEAKRNGGETAIATVKIEWEE